QAEKRRAGGEGESAADRWRRVRNRGEQPDDGAEVGEVRGDDRGVVDAIQPEAGKGGVQRLEVAGGDDREQGGGPGGAGGRAVGWLPVPREREAGEPEQETERPMRGEIHAGHEPEP